METGTTRNDILNRLTLSVHGDLNKYRSFTESACADDPEFLAHLIAWDYVNGTVKDTKVALPIITLGSRSFPLPLTENSLAHLCLHPPRELLKALRFAISYPLPSSRQKLLEKTIRRYLEFKESIPAKWMRMAVRHRRPLKELYVRTHRSCPQWVSDILFLSRYPKGSVFADIASLRNLPPNQVAAVIEKWHLSPLIVSGALSGSKSVQSNSSVIAATINQMSATEAVTKSASLSKKGVGKDKVLKEVFRKKIAGAVSTSKSILKTSVAADEVDDDSMRTMLRELQERQISHQKATGKGIDGNWLVISDCSSSQSHSITLGLHVASSIAKFVTGGVQLAFCNDAARVFNATGKSLEGLRKETQYVRAHGYTSYGVGLEASIRSGFRPDGIAIIGDGGENRSPLFHNIYSKCFSGYNLLPPVYFFRTSGDDDVFSRSMSSAGVKVEKFDLSSGSVDYYSIPNLVQTMSSNPFTVCDRVMAAPLLTLDQVFALPTTTTTP
jgi:hypothetical protein